MGQEYTIEGRVFRQRGFWNILGRVQSDMCQEYTWGGVFSQTWGWEYIGGGVSRQTGVRNILGVEGGFSCRHGWLIYSECGEKGVFFQVNMDQIDP